MSDYFPGCSHVSPPGRCAPIRFSIRWRHETQQDIHLVGGTGPRLAACVDNTPSAPPPVSESPTVTIEDMRFNSDHVTIEEGDTATWVWEDVMPHDVSGDGFKSEVQSEGTFSHTFDEAGSYPYVCTLHSGMKGTVTIVEV
ncbi:MAG: plastocyanin/azurin family copper-binding protein [Acidimicrobiia bacterium]